MRCGSETTSLVAEHGDFFAATRQLVSTTTERGQSLREAEVIIFTLNIWQRGGLQTGRRDTEGGAAENDIGK